MYRRRSLLRRFLASVFTKQPFKKIRMRKHVLASPKEIRLGLRHDVRIECSYAVGKERRWNIAKSPQFASRVIPQFGDMRRHVRASARKLRTSTNSLNISLIGLEIAYLLSRLPILSLEVAIGVEIGRWKTPRPSYKRRQIATDIEVSEASIRKGKLFVGVFFELTAKRTILQQRHFLRVKKEAHFVNALFHFAPQLTTGISIPSEEINKIAVEGRFAGYG